MLSEPEEVWETVAEVVALWPAFHQAWLMTPDGRQLAITEDTEGLRLDLLREGQQVHCVVTTEFPRVLHASLLG